MNRCICLLGLRKLPLSNNTSPFLSVKDFLASSDVFVVVNVITFIEHYKELYILCYIIFTTSLCIVCVCAVLSRV